MARTIEDILRTDRRTQTPQEIKDDTLYLRRQLQKRIDRLEKYERQWGIKSPALERLRETGYMSDDFHLRGTKGMSEEGLRGFNEALRAFGQSSTSKISDTPGGGEGFYKNKIDRPIKQMSDYTGIPVEKISPMDAKKFWDAVDEAKRLYKARGGRVGVYRKDSDPVMNAVADEWIEKEGTSQINAEDAINRIKELNTAFQEQEDDELPF